MFEQLNWKAPAEWSQIRCIDMHTGGEPLRIPIAGLPEVFGNTVLEKRDYFKNNLDHIRRQLMLEPRGHADMYGAIISEPSLPEADFDAFFMHNEGYSTMCGHAVIALTKFAFESNLLPNKKNNQLIINVPAGTIHAEAKIEQGKVVECSFRNVPSFLYLKDKSVDVPGIGQVDFDLAFGGAFYALVEANNLGLQLTTADYFKLIEYGRLIKQAVQEKFPIVHPTEAGLSFLYGTIFTGVAKQSENHSRNVCIFADGEVDRSATGSGVSARAAQYFAKKELDFGEAIRIESILGSTMTVEVLETVNYHGLAAVVPRVTGQAWFVGEQVYYHDKSDPWKNGFMLR